MLDISWFVGMGAGVNAKKTQTRVRKKVVAVADEALTTAAEVTQEAEVGRALSLEVAPANIVEMTGERTVGTKAKAADAVAAKDGEADAKEGRDGLPKCETASAVDILVRNLTREVEGAPPFAGEWREVFLQALERAPIVAVAAKIAGVSRARAMDARLADAEFARRWDEAMEDGVDAIEAAAFRSAVFGEEKPVYHQGQVKGWTVEYSHAARAMLLKSRRPQIFGDKEEAKGQASAPMTLEDFRRRVEEARRG